jgi:large subunit ribosomal protein L15
LTAAGLTRAGLPIKLLANGKLTHALTVKVDKASQSAREQITAAGGTLEAHEDAPDAAPGAKE